MGRSEHDKRSSSPGRYSGLLEFGQCRKLIRGDDEPCDYKGYAKANNRLLGGRTFAARLKYEGNSEYEQDIFNLVLPAPEEADD